MFIGFSQNGSNCNETSFEKLKPRVINHKSFESKFREELLFELLNSDLENNGSGFEEFIEVCLETRNNHALTIKMYVQGNHLPFMNKTLSKAIGIGFAKIILKIALTKTKENIYKIKKNSYYVTLLRKSKKEFYSSLDVRIL